MSTVENFFAPCPRGLEQVLSEELKSFGAQGVTITPGGCSFAGPFALVYEVNLRSRIASRVMWKITDAPYRVEADLHKLAHETPWERYFAANQTLRVDVVATRSPLKSLKFATLTVKDGICDRFREREGVRPDIAKLGANVRVYAYLNETKVTLYLDTSGEALFKRGYRQSEVNAPIRENLAAGILKLIGWQPGVPLMDPMCGSGTFLIEAAHACLQVPPGLGAKRPRRYGFFNLKQFDPPVWQRLRDHARTDTKPQSLLPLFGADIDREALRATLSNFTEAQIDEAIRVSPGDVLNAKAPAPTGILITNPPYGERIGELDELADFYPKLGDALKRNFPGWSCWIITADKRIEKLMRLKPSRRIPLMNGDLDCRLYEYRVVAGSNREQLEPSA